MTNGSPPCLRMTVKKHDEDTLHWREEVKVLPPHVVEANAAGAPRAKADTGAPGEDPDPGRWADAILVRGGKRRGSRDK